MLIERRDLPEGFEYSEMAPFIGFGRLKLPSWITEHYVSLCVGRVRALFVICHMKAALAPAVCTEWKRRDRWYWRGWWRNAAY